MARGQQMKRPAAAASSREGVTAVKHKGMPVTDEVFVLSKFISTLMTLGGYQFTSKAKEGVLRLGGACSGTNAARFTLESYLGKANVTEVVNSENNRSPVSFQMRNYKQTCCVFQETRVIIFSKIAWGSLAYRKQSVAFPNYPEQRAPLRRHVHVH